MIFTKREIIHGPLAETAYQRMSILLKDENRNTYKELNSSGDIDPFSSYDGRSSINE